MKRVLLIDDDQAALLKLAEMLDMLGFDTLTALDGADGVKMAVAHNPDLILCDIIMPRVDGFEAVWQIRQDESTANIPFVLCSVFTDDTTRQKAMKAGANAVIGKPVSLSDLLALVSRHLEEAA